MKEETIRKADPPQPDSDLLLFISWKEENYLNASQAFDLFAKRYSPYLAKISQSVCKESQKYFSSNLPDQVLNNTLFYVWENPEEVLTALDKNSGQFEDDLIVKAALGRIAKSVFFDEVLTAERMFGKEGRVVPIKKLKKGELVYHQEMMPEKVDDPPDASKADKEFEVGDEVILYQKAMSMLTTREQYILKITLGAGENELHKDSEISKMLSRQLNLLPDNIRQIRKRALDKLRKKKEELRPLLSKERAARIK